MKLRSRWLLAVLLFLMVSARARAVEPAGSITVHSSKPGVAIGPLFYGLMTEEINHAYDGGLYAELIQNRIFADDPRQPAHWSLLTPAGAAGNISLDPNVPVNSGALKTSLRWEITQAGNGPGVSVANDGFWGIPVHPHTRYRASFYARSGNGFNGPLTIAIQKNGSSDRLAAASIPSIGIDWKKYQVELTTGDVAVSTDNVFVLSASSKGTLWLSLVSLFPPTYHDRPNGNRVDLMDKLAALHPKFLRFPGGNFLEGDYLNTHFQWKQTIGPLEGRPGHPGCWGYRASDGLGLLEFLEWCEDLHMQPLLAVYAGYSLKGDYFKVGPDFQPVVQEALDEIEYCTGDASTTWGARRVKDGHPTPFTIHYVEIGNEDEYDKSHTYDARFAQIYDAIKSKYPAIQCIATTPVSSRKPDLIDDHDYPSPHQMLRTTERYEHRDSSLPKVFFGEWATQDGTPTPTVRAALADAAWMTGLQHVANTVLMNCYAPLLVNTNPGGWEWPTNLIGYNAATSFGSPSYYVQQMFSSNLGNVDLPTDVVEQKIAEPPLPMPQGGIGFGTYLTAAEYKDITVTHGNQTLYQADLSTNGVPKDWRTAGSGTWRVLNGALQQTDDTTYEPLITNGQGSWQDYTFSCKARKISGAEGFFILVHVRNGLNMMRVNLGGWSDTRSSMQRIENGTHPEVGNSVPFTIDTGRWYDIRVDVAGREVTCYVDGKLICHATDSPLPIPHHVFAAASRDDATDDVILKVVNVAGQPQQLKINFDGSASFGPEADLLVLSGDANDVNTVAEPTRVAPRRFKLSTDAALVEAFPRHSVSVIRLHASAVR